MSEVFGTQWQGEFSEHAELTQIHSWISTFYTKVNRGELSQSLAELIDTGIDKKLLRDQANSLTALCKAIAVQAQTLKELIQIPNSNPNHDLAAMQFTQLNALLGGWKNSALLYDFARYNQIIQAFESYQIKAFTELAYSWHTASDLLMTVFELSYYRGLVDHAYDSSEAIRRFDRNKHCLLYTSPSPRDS